MTLRIRLMLRWAFLALPFQMRQCNRSTSATIAAFAVARSGSSVDKFAVRQLRVLQTHRDVEPCVDDPVGSRASKRILTGD
jgi:hypothetical protein